MELCTGLRGKMHMRLSISVSINWMICQKSVDPNTNPNDSIPEIIGESVKLDASIPNEIYVPESNKNPNIDVKYVGISGISK